VWGLAMAIVLQCSAHALHAAHLVQYRSDGIGIWALNALSEHLLMVSQVVHMFLIMVIACGYTLLQSKLPSDLDFTKLVLAAVLLAHSALVGIGKMADDSHKHHENDGVVGWSLLTLRLVLLGWFWQSTRETRRQAPLRMQLSLRQFQIIGSLQLVSYPLLFLSVRAFAPYLRHPIMQTGVFGIQLASDMWLGSLFLSRGTYFQISTLNSLLLPCSASCKLD